MIARFAKQMSHGEGPNSNTCPQRRFTRPLFFFSITSMRNTRRPSESRCSLVRRSTSEGFNKCSHLTGSMEDFTEGSTEDIWLIWLLKNLFDFVVVLAIIKLYQIGLRTLFEYDRN